MATTIVVALGVKSRRAESESRDAWKPARAEDRTP